MIRSRILFRMPIVIIGQCLEDAIEEVSWNAINRDLYNSLPICGPETTKRSWRRISWWRFDGHLTVTSDGRIRAN